MSRSLKKGPYIEPKLEARVIAQNEGGKKSVIKTWSRASMISPDFVGQTIAVHNGNKFIPVYVTENMNDIVILHHNTFTDRCRSRGKHQNHLIFKLSL